MNKAFAVIGLGLALSGVAFAQQKTAKEEIVGAWTLVSVTSETDDGNKGEPFGPSPKGVIIFSNDGHFSLFQSRAEIPKIAANDRAKATREEAQSVVASSIAYYSTYLIDEKTDHFRPSPISRPFQGPSACLNGAKCGCGPSP